MKVKATKMGFYGKGVSMRRRREGEIFEISDPKHFSSRWMVKVEAEAPPAALIEEVKEEIVTSEAPQKPRGNPNWGRKA